MPAMLKYVRLFSSCDGDAFVFTLPPVSHAAIAKVHETLGYQPVSAGFVHFGPAGGITVHGRSASLSLGPMPDDAARIQMLYHFLGRDVREDLAHGAAASRSSSQPTHHHA